MMRCAARRKPASALKHVGHADAGFRRAAHRIMGIDPDDIFNLVRYAAQTLANCYTAMEMDLEVVPVLNKIDLPAADPERVSRTRRSSTSVTPTPVFAEQRTASWASIPTISSISLRRRAAGG
jgi:hypothetical protein